MGQDSPHAYHMHMQYAACATWHISMGMSMLDVPPAVARYPEIHVTADRSTWSEGSEPKAAKNIGKRATGYRGILQVRSRAALRALGKAVRQ